MNGRSVDDPPILDAPQFHRVHPETLAGSAANAAESEMDDDSIAAGGVIQDLYLQILPTVENVIARGVFTSVADLKRKLIRYIRQYNKAPKPIRWIYPDPSNRITTTSTVTGNRSS